MVSHWGQRAISLEFLGKSRGKQASRQAARGASSDGGRIPFILQFIRHTDQERAERGYNTRVKGCREGGRERRARRGRAEDVIAF